MEVVDISICCCCSSPMVEGSRLYELNYSISCAILFGGALATKALRYGYMAGNKLGNIFCLLLNQLSDWL